MPQLSESKKMTRLATIILMQIVLSAGFASTALSADDINKTEAFDIDERISGPRVYIGAGVDNLSERKGTDVSAYGMIEAASSVLHEPTGLRFRMGADLSEVGAWAGVGISTEYVFDEDPFYIEASFLAGAYKAFGELDLDHTIEFRSQVAVGYHFDNNYDVAIGYSHKSNASLSSNNPGAEALYIRLGRGF